MKDYKIRKKIIPTLEKSLETVDMVALAAIVFISIYGVVSRYIFKKPLFWGMELSTSLAVWMTFLIAGVNYKRDIHFKVDILYGALNKKLKVVDDMVVALVTLVCIGICLYSAVVSFVKNYKISMAAMEISVSYTLYLPLIIGYTTYVLFMIVQFFSKRKENGQEGV